MIKKLKYLLLAGLLPVLSCSTSHTAGRWTADYGDRGTVTFFKDGQAVFPAVYASFDHDGHTVSSRDYPSCRVSVSDRTGVPVLTLRYSGGGLPELRHIFTLLPEGDYLLAAAEIGNGRDTVRTGCISPVNIDALPLPGPQETCRALFIPFDNDCWIRYRSCPLDFGTLRSYEATALFDNASRQGIVAGSVDHDTWKSAVDMCSDGNFTLRCTAGVADSLTRDRKPHGAVTGTQVCSPQMMLGLFSDWREGLETFAAVNKAAVPKRPWDGAVPFGWNSWGVLQFGLTSQKALEVSDFFRENLQPAGFFNPDGTVVVGLDSGWNRFTEDELKAFADKCRTNGQVAGIYWTPFADWGKNPDREFPEGGGVKFGEVYLYANGEPQWLDNAWALDPTHPAVEARMKKTAELFRRCGFEYVKLDFLTHGAMEADRWYRPEIRTGMEGYAYGMKLIDKYFNGMFVNLSISPAFPAQYADSRRIACDAWSKIKDTEYTMNALSYGWWLGGVYSYNDADHIVLQKVTEGENRARVTSAVITGLYIAGDDFSAQGSKEGKERAIRFLTNPRINTLATGRPFRPVEGDGEHSEWQFVRTDGATTCYVAFNYGDMPKTATIPFARLGLSAEGYTATELWSGTEIDPAAPLVIPAADVKVIRLEKR